MIRNVLIAMIIAAMLVACGDGNKKMSQKEIKAALGVVDGQANELRIGGVLLRIPSKYKIKFVDVDEKKIKAKAYDEAVWRVTFHMDLSSWFEPPPVTPAEGNALVRISISNKGYEDPAEREQDFESRDWVSRRDIPEWGLREYISKLFPKRSGWGALSYRALDATPPMGGPILFGCSTEHAAEKRNEAKAAQCGSGFQTEQGPTVGYMLSNDLLPRWKDVHTEVLNLVNSLIVEE